MSIKLTDLLGGGASGSPIKSIQRGSIAFQYQQTGNIAIAAVNLSKSMLNINNRPGWIADANGSQASLHAGAQLTSPTNIYYAAGDTETPNNIGNGTLYWEVIEYV